VDALEVSNPPSADDLERIAERVPDLRGYPLRAEPLPGGTGGSGLSSSRWFLGLKYLPASSM